MKRRLADRLSDKFAVSPTGCWIWTAYTGPDGYGRISVNDRPMLAHRASYTVHVGPIPEGLVVDHKCHTPACINPAHLRAITQKQNIENRSGLSSNNRSGYRGVSYWAARSRWRAYVGGKSIGYFDTAREAGEAAAAARTEMFTHSDMDRSA